MATNPKISYERYTRLFTLLAARKNSVTPMM
jgi:hypothetical protein